jgi:hypothetical protein
MNSFGGVIIIDTNLGLDINSDYWKNFFSQHSCSPLCLTDLEVIFSQLKEVKPIAAYVPAPIYYYIKTLQINL